MTATDEPPARTTADRDAGPSGDDGLVLPDGTPVTPVEPPFPSPAVDPEHGSWRYGQPFSPRAVMARVPVRRITRVQAIALVVFSLVALGPVLALVVVLRTDTSTLPIVVAEPDITAEDGLILTMTVTSVNAVTREMGVRMAIRSSSAGPDGLIEGGRMTETVNLGIPAEGSIQGSSTISLDKGTTVGAVEFVTPLTNGSIARYPYDTYAAHLVVIASREGDGDLGTASSANPPTSASADGGSGRIAVPISIVVAADVPGFVITGDLPEDGSSSTGTVDLSVRRDGPTLLYATWIMVLWWALSISAVLLVWAAGIWRSSPPPWAYGYLVGVLFALAPLRSALPGTPPYGVLIDYVSFYWAVGTMGLGLLILVSFFLRDARIEGRHRTREEEAVHDRTADASYDTGETPVVVPVAPLPVPLGTEPMVPDSAPPSPGGDAAPRPTPDEH